MSLLHSTIDRLRRRLRRLLIVRGLCWGAAAALAVVLVAAGIDLLVHVDSPLTRFALLLAGVGLGLWVIVVRVVRPLFGPWDDVSMALLLERLQPSLRDRLASAVQIAADQRVTSTPLSRAAMRDAELRVSSLQRASLIDRQTTVLAGALLLFVGLCGVVWLAFDARAALALERQLFPFSGAEWPRSTVLSLLDEDLQPLDGRRLVAGEPLTFYIANSRGPVPENVRVERRAGDEQVERVDAAPTALRDPTGQERQLAVATVVPEKGTLRLRATGGDDRSMSWRVFDVVAAPRLEWFRIRVDPPGYTGLPVVEEERGVAHVEGVVGSRVTVQAQSSAPLAGATIRREGNVDQELTIDDGGLSFTASFEISQEGRTAYRLDIVDANGVGSMRPLRYEIRGRKDQPPTVVVTHPAERETISPMARLPLRAECNDDLGLATVGLAFSTDAAIDVRRQPLWNAPAGDGASAPVTLYRAETHWDLRELGLEAGRVVTYQIEVSDRRTPDPQAGRSRQQTLVVVTPEEKQREIQEYQAGLARLLARLERRQDEALQQTRELTAQWSNASRLRDEDSALLSHLQLERRRLLGDLTDARTGFVPQAERIVDELEWNRLEDPATAARMQRLTAQVTMIVEQMLPQLGRSLDAVSATVSGDPAAGGIGDGVEGAATGHSAPADAGVALAEAEYQQAAIANTLRAMITELAEWRQQFDSSQRLAELLSSQKEVQAATKELGRRTLTRSLFDLDDQERADLARTAERQRHLGELLSRLRELNASASMSNGGDPQRAPAAPLERLADGELDALIREAAEHLAANRIGQAVEDQQAIVERLERTLRDVAAAGVADVESLLAAIDQARDDVESLRKRQEETAARARSLRLSTVDEETEQQLQVLRKEQTELASETESLSVRLRRQGLGAPGNSATRAASRMREAERALSRRDGVEAEASQQETLDDLQQVERELAVAQQSAEQRRAMELLAGLPAELESLRRAEQSIHEATVEIEQERARTRRLTRAALKRVSELATDQRRVQKEVVTLQARLEGMELLQSVLGLAADAMERAAESLGRRETGGPVTSAQQSAIDRLAALIEATGPLPQSTSEATEENQPASAQEAIAETSRTLQVRLVRSLQAGLLERTESLRAAAESDPSAEVESGLQEVAAEQRELAEVLRKLLSPGEEGGRGPAGVP